MWGIKTSGPNTVSAQIDGVTLSAPASISMPELKQKTVTHVVFTGDPNELCTFLDHSLESMGYASKPAHLEARNSPFGEQIIDVKLERSGIKPTRIKAGMTQHKRKSFLLFSLIGAFVLIGSTALWLTVVCSALVAIGIALWHIAPPVKKYQYHPAFIALWVQAKGTAYKGTRSKVVSVEKADGTQDQQHVQTTHLDSQLDVFIGAQTGVEKRVLNEYVLADGEKDGPSGWQLIKAAWAGEKEVRIGNTQKYNELISSPDELEQTAHADIKELQHQLTAMATVT